MRSVARADGAGSVGFERGFASCAERERETDRQTDRQRERQTDRERERSCRGALPSPLSSLARSFSSCRATSFEWIGSAFPFCLVCDAAVCSSRGRACRCCGRSTRRASYTATSRCVCVRACNISIASRNPYKFICWLRTPRHQGAHAHTRAHTHTPRGGARAPRRQGASESVRTLRCERTIGEQRAMRVVA